MEQILLDITESIRNLTHSNCDLAKARLPDHQRCIGRCLAPNTESDRCNLPRMNDKWCRYHHDVCSIAVAAYRKLTEGYDDLASKYTDKIESSTWTTLSQERYQHLFKNKNKLVNIDDLSPLQDWIELLDMIGIEEILINIDNVLELMGMFVRFYLASEVRFLNVNVCFFDHRIDKKYYIALIIAASIANKLLIFMGFDKFEISLTSIAQRYTDMKLFTDNFIFVSKLLRGLFNNSAIFPKFTWFRSIPLDINPVTMKHGDITCAEDGDLLNLLAHMFGKYHGVIEGKFNNEFYQDRLSFILSNSSVNSGKIYYDHKATLGLSKFVSSPDNIIPKVFAKNTENFKFSDLEELLDLIIEYGHSDIEQDYIQALQRTRKKISISSPVDLSEALRSSGIGFENPIPTPT